MRFAYEWHDDSGNWFRSYGNENWAFDEQGLMYERHASINDLPIREDQRLFRWPLGRRPDDHPSLGELDPEPAPAGARALPLAAPGGQRLFHPRHCPPSLRSHA